jgi:hypothetical protein
MEHYDVDTQDVGAHDPVSWLDELVELHVLARNGDAGAAEQAERWISSDPAARRVWDDVEQTCDRLRRDPHG